MHYFYFVPLLLIMSTNLWNGVTMNVSVVEAVLYILSMLCVGFMEEVIFRGLLFKAICKSNLKRAILISSVINSLSVFAVQGSQMFYVVSAAALCVVSVGYVLWIWKEEFKANLVVK